MEMMISHARSVSRDDPTVQTNQLESAGESQPIQVHRKFTSFVLVFIISPISLFLNLKFEIKQR